MWEFTPGSLSRLVTAVGLRMVRIEQAKIPPGHPHGTKTRAQRLAMAALDRLNVPLTRALGVLGDRIVLVARNPAVD